MLELNFLEWKRELELIVEDTYGISLSEFCKVKNLPSYYRMDYSPISAFEELDEIYSN